MSTVSWLFDLALAGGLLGLAWRTMVAPGLFRGIILYIAFGLLMALVWARLAAPDLALAEAAIGAGLTGALLLRTYHALGAAGDRGWMPPHRRLVLVIAAGSILLLVGALAYVLTGLPRPDLSAGDRALAQLSTHALSNPVTAVLLDFRAYDTLLEMAVLLLAMLGARLLVAPSGEPAAPQPVDAMVTALARLLTPIILVTAGYLLWSGTHAAGGAFQAGALLAGLAVLLILAGRIQPAPLFRLAERGIAVLGLGLFTLAGAAMLALGRVWLDWPGDLTYALVVVLETSLMLSIGYTLALLFAAAPGLRREGP